MTATRLLRAFPLLLVPLFASAQTPTVLEQRIVVETTGWTTPGASASVATLSVQGQLRLLPSWSFAFDVPTAAGWIAGDRSGRASIGNPSVGLHGAVVAWSRNRIWAAFWMRPFLTIPTTYSVAPTNEAIGRASMLTVASVSSGLVGFHRYFPELGCIGLPFGVEVVSTGQVRFALELSFPISAPLGLDAPQSAWALSFESTSTLEFTLPMGLLLGFRLQFVTAAPIHKLNLGIEPFLGLDGPYEPFFLHVGFLLGTGGLLNPPYDSGYISTAIIRVGTRF